MITFANYQLTEQLHESSNSLVYRGYEPAEERPVVVKLLKGQYPSPEKIAWFKREYEVTGGVALRGVVDVYSWQSEPNRWAIVLEDFGGESLQKLHVAGRLTTPDFLKLATEVSDILGQIHQQHIMHKDINPSNIVFNPATGQVKMIDFGISTVLSREKTTFRNPDVLEGTLAYISPEQTGRMNRAMDYRTDFYSLGVTFYELLTGQLPFATTDSLTLVHAHIAQQPIPPHELNPAIPEPLADIILKLMAKNAEERYQSAYGLKADLEACWQEWESKGRIESFVLARQDLWAHFQIPQKLYGREAEIDILLAGASRVSQGASEVMLVSGYSGIGKSALVAEIYKPITSQRGYFISGKYDQLRRNIPYAPLIQAFGSLMRHLLTESEASLALWREKLLTTLGNNGQVIIEVIPEAERIIGPQPAVPELPPKEAQNRFNLLFENFINLFAQPEHPLVLFLDDLQWADRPSLALIQSLMTAANSRYLFLIGAYRDNEVGSAHPLNFTLDEMRKAGTIVNEISLRPLNVAHVTQLIAETVNCDLATAQRLAELVQAKSGGNPFFLAEFLKTLYAEGLIRFDYKEGQWQWKLAQIQAQDITDNVVDLMAGKVQQLPTNTQAVLKLASCIGNQFDLATLATVYQKTATDTALDLWEAMDAGFILPLSDAYKLIDVDVEGLAEDVTVAYKFAHDRIQQAVYSLIPESEKQALHLQIGRLLLQSMPQEHNIFDLVNQMNVGQELIDQQSERDDLAQLNLTAGQKAKESAAYEPAFNYFKEGLKLLTPPLTAHAQPLISDLTYSWQRKYDLTLSLHVQAAESAMLNREYEQTEQLTAQVLQHARTLLDQVKVHQVLIDAHYAQGNFLEALKIGKEVLSLLGIVFPEEPTMEDFGLNMQGVQSALADRQSKSLTELREDLIDLPLMTDPEKRAAITIMSSLLGVSFRVANSLYPLLVCKQVMLFLTEGNAVESPFIYACYGSLLGLMGDFENASQFGQLALELVGRLHATEFQAKTYHVKGFFISSLSESMTKILEEFLIVYQSGAENGDFQYAAYGATAYCFSLFLAGRELGGVDQEMAKFSPAIAQLRQSETYYWHRIYWQATLNLMGRSEDKARLIGEAYNETNKPLIYQEIGDIGTLFHLYLNKVMISYRFEAFQQAYEDALEMDNYMAVAEGSCLTLAAYLYSSLARLAVFADVSKAEQEEILQSVSPKQEKMKLWAQHAPMNHLHKYYLVEAERARVLAHDQEAREYYDKAIDLAQENENLSEEALAYELAGRFYLAKGNTRLARYYLRDAHYANQRWGALAKVEQLEEKYPFLAQTTRDKRSATSTTTTTGTRASTSLDIESVLKANQAIAGEIQLGALLEKMIKIVIENAGAERGFLVLQKGGQWVIEAQGTIESTQGTVLQDLPISSDLLPLSILNYVARSTEHVVLADATDSGQFTSDPYIVAKRPQSILCMPLLNQGRLTAIVYLENNLATGAFTPERLEVLNLLSSQAAISLENATLYNTLEQKVEERTILLQHEIVERKRAEEAANEANQAKSTFLANMSHELRTPLNAILGFAQIMKRRKRDDSTDQRQLDIIRRSGEHLLTLINSVLDLSKIEAGKMSLNPNHFDLLQLLEELSEMFGLPAKDKGLQLNFEIAPDLPRYVRTDAVKLRQVLLNLLSNAIKFTEQGGVSLHVQQYVAGQLHFEVADSGVGIAAEELESLFEAFTQTQAGKYKQEGTGLGLPISQQFVRLMGGEISVESQACADPFASGGSIRRGTRVIFDIQVEEVDAPADTQNIEHHVIGLAPNQPRYRILIVDDKWDNRQLLINLLKPLGFDVAEASNGQEAIGLWQTWQPSLIWMDIRMPVMDGYQATRHIKNSTSGTSAPIIALTASIYEEEQAAILEAGCDDFLRKPFRPQQLFELMKKHLGVRYVYSDEEDSAPTSPSRLARSRAPANPLTPAALSRLPGKWRQDFHQAMSELNLRLMMAQIEEIRPQNEPLADALTELVTNFQFEKLSNLLEEAEA